MPLKLEVALCVHGVISPLLANVYLHYVFDLWAQQWRRREVKGDMIIVRYADDLVVGFEHEAEARRFWNAMRTRFGQFSLELHGDKTRLLQFGRYAIERRQRHGQGKPQTCNFLGFNFICGCSRRGAFLLRRHTRRDRMRVALREIKDEMRRRRHDSLADQGRWLRSVVTGYFAYHAVPTHAHAIGAYRHHVIDLWRRSLRRRSQKDRMTWTRMDRLAAEWLPSGCLHPVCFILGPNSEWPSATQGRSRMPESGTYGSVRGVPGNRHPYRDRQPLDRTQEPAAMKPHYSHTVGLECAFNVICLA
jgi:RNA-directed DNA polymerase